MTRLTRFLSALALGVLTAASAGTVQAQQGGPYSPRIIVNDRAITNWEVNQRITFLKVLNSSGDLEKQALDGLIDDRLRMDAARDQGITASDEDVKNGMEEFAGRANLSADEFIKAIGQRGVAAQTFRDFVRSGILWRQVVRAKYGPRTQVSEAEVDRAVALSARQGGARVLLSEIVLPADTPERQAESRALAQQLSRQIKSQAAFASAARQYSVSGSKGRGGRIDWIDLSTLPPQIASQVLTLGPGEVSEPVQVPNAIALFQLRAIQETDAPQPQTLAVDYAQYFLPGGDAGGAARILAKIDTCDDLYGVAKGQPEERLQRQTQQVSEIPQDIALELAKLDANESEVLNRAGRLSVLMLCARTPELGQEVNRDQVRLRLVNQRLSSYANSYLAELKADAIIREP
ncbi:MAG: peptidylprolyl isomerase [Paracoccaceae bacterium]